MVPYVVSAVLAMTVICFACVYAARLLSCGGGGNAGVGYGEVWLW